MPLVGGHSRGRRIRRWPATAATALVAVGAAIAMVSTAGTATVTLARLTSVASTPGGDPAAGTVKAQVTQPQQTTVRHAAIASSAAATGSLSTVLSESVHGGYTAAGTGMRNLGYGTISITGIPAGVTVKSATLLWDILADSAGPSFAQGSLDGKAFTGTPWVSGASPAILAQKLGYDSQNHAVEGVCAGIGNDCPAHSVDWQIQQVPASFIPSLITLTVGADDINFGGCFQSIIENGDESMQSRTDPCNPATLSRHLADFKGKLAKDLKTLQGKYPGVPIQVMDYYNPFPSAPVAKQSACPFSDVATLTYEDARIGWLNTVDTFILHHGQFNDDARTVQGLLFKDAQTVLNQLNLAINTTSSGIAKVVSTNDFAGHDICAHGSEWVFSPTFAVDMSLKVGPVSKSAHLEIGGDEVCPDPVSPVDKNFTISKQFKNTFLHISASLNIAGGLNCLPHPTVAGQTAIADDFLNQGA